VAAQALRSDALNAVPGLLESPEPEVRAAAVFALGACVQTQSVQQQGGPTPEVADHVRRMPPAERAQAERHLARRLLDVVDDACPLVRAEVAVAFGRIASGHADMFQASPAPPSGASA
jgi:regulator-associated protein of mTOR